MPNRKTLEARAAHWGFSLLEHRPGQNPAHAKYRGRRWSLASEDTSDALYLDTLSNVEFVLDARCHSALDRPLPKVNFRGFIDTCSKFSPMRAEG